MAEGVLPPTKEGIGAMTKLDQLYAEKGKKFDEICALLAREAMRCLADHMTPLLHAYVVPDAEMPGYVLEVRTAWQLQTIAPSSA